MQDPTWISVLPPVLAIILAIASRQVYLSLASGVWLGWTILSDWNVGAGLAQTIDGLVRGVGDATGGAALGATRKGAPSPREDRHEQRNAQLRAAPGCLKERAACRISSPDGE